MSGEDIDLEDMLGPDPEAENLVDAAPKKSQPMGRNARALLARSSSYPVNPNRTRRGGRKNTPEMLNRLLALAREMPVGTDVAMRAGISYSALRYWLQSSKEGYPGDGYDVAEPNNDTKTVRFHQAWDDAMLSGAGPIEVATHRKARGYQEVLTYRGRVIYKLDPDRVLLYNELGLPIDDRDQALWLRDEFGAPIPETVEKQDPDLAMFLLTRLMPEKYGNKSQVDVNVRGGVLVVGMRANTSEDLNEIEDKYRKEGLPAVTFDEGGDDDT